MDVHSTDWWTPVFGAVFVLLGFGAAWRAIRHRMHAFRAPTWLATDGLVIESELERGVDFFHWDPMVKYRYEVNGAEYNGTNVRFGAVYSVWKSSAQRVIDKYPAGKHVAVYYDPRKPSRACLERQASALWLLGLAVGIVFVLGGLRMMLTGDSPYD